MVTVVKGWYHIDSVANTEGGVWVVADGEAKPERTTSQPSAGSIERALNEQPVVVLATARKGTDDGW
jgi:hypothetical protein